MKLTYIFFLGRRALVVAALLLGFCTTGAATAAPRLAATPPMGWNDWAHYQCGFTAATILANARALVRSGLAARGYDTVTIDDCWMLEHRDARGDLQADPRRFPHGMRPVAEAIHALGLRFGIYEDAGYETCGGFAGSGAGRAGGEAHFLADARLFASWGVDYLKLDGCNVHLAQGQSQEAAYREAYRAESRALRRVGRPIVFSQSAPAYFQGTPEWYDVLTWVRGYGQLWREGTDVAIYDRSRPTRSRFASVMWNYDYNLQLARFQRPGNWNDADFIIGGDHGMTLAETRSQLALWSMMSAPLILSSNVRQLSPAAIGILGNRAVLAVDQDPLGRMASLVRRSAAMDVLMKTLDHGAYAIAVLNRGSSALRVRLLPGELGFAGVHCRLRARNLWTHSSQDAMSELTAEIAPHDTAMWRIRPAADCGTAARIGAITRIVPRVPSSQIVPKAPPGPTATRHPGAQVAPVVRRGRPDAEHYTRCLAAPGAVERCAGSAAEVWRITSDGTLRAAHGCLTQTGSHAALAACGTGDSQRWRYTLRGNLINAGSRLCLTGALAGGLRVRRCGHNLPSQIWSLPGGLPAR